MKKLLIPSLLLLAIAAYIAMPLIKAVASPEPKKKKTLPVAVSFEADSAYSFIAAQCNFGPRVMNTKEHDACGEWLVEKFRSLGCEVKTQRADLKAFDGTTLRATNIIARHKPELQGRILIASHWDSRPWADNDPDSTLHRQPVMGANDGASGVGVMIELARLLQHADSVQVGIDFVCFDAEDYGAPYWKESELDDSGFALGAAHYAENLGTSHGISYGILLDMVGGQGARFYEECISKYFAQDIINKVWRAARDAGYESYFPRREGSYITDDHLPVNQTAGIKMIDIINHYPDCPQGSFGMTWHTVHDDLAHIDKAALKAVGQTLVQLIWSK